MSYFSHWLLRTTWSWGKNARGVREDVAWHWGEKELGHEMALIWENCLGSCMGSSWWRIVIRSSEPVPIKAKEPLFRVEKENWLYAEHQSKRTDCPGPSRGEEEAQATKRGLSPLQKGRAKSVMTRNPTVTLPKDPKNIGSQSLHTKQWVRVNCFFLRLGHGEKTGTASPHRVKEIEGKFLLRIFWTYNLF